jgi:hypothetical protein
LTNSLCVDWSKSQFVKHSSELMSLVGNFYSRITAQKIKELLGPSAIPTIVELQEAVLDGEQVQGSEILLRLGGLRLRVQEHMHNLVVGDAIQEIVDVLALVSFHNLLSLQSWNGALFPLIHRPTRSTLRRNHGFHPPNLHNVLKSTRSPQRLFESAVSSSNRSSRANPSSSWKPSEPDRRKDSGITLNQGKVPPGILNRA